jgi:hypothetical protein
LIIFQHLSHQQALQATAQPAASHQNVQMVLIIIVCVLLCMCVPGLARYNIHGVIKYFSFSYFVIKTFSALNRAPMKSAADTPLRFVFKRAREIIIKKGIIIIIIQLIYIAEIFILKFIFIFIFSAHGLFWQIILK